MFHPTARVALCLFAAALAACSSSLTQRRWTEVRTPHIRLITDRNEAAARQLAVELETFRAVTAAIVGGLPEGEPVPTDAYVFAASDDFRRFSPEEELAGYFLPGWRRHFIALSGPPSSTAAMFLKHEYVHALMQRSPAAYPLWYQEGLAEFLSTAEFRNGKVLLGQPPPRPGLFRLSQIAKGRRVSRTGSHIALPMGAPVDDADFDYASYWAIVHFLVFGHLTAGVTVDRRTALRRYLTLLGGSESAEAAFAQAFGTDYEGMSKQVLAYVAADQFPTVAQALPDLGGSAYPTRRLTEGEIALGLGQLALAVEKADLAESLFSTALAKGDREGQAAAGIAMVELARGHQESGVQQFEALFAQHPKQTSIRLDCAAYLIGRAQRSANQAELAGWLGLLQRVRPQVAQAAQASPADFAAQALLGLTYSEGDADVAPGIRALEVALAQVPGDPRLHYQLGMLSWRAGDLRGAKVHLQSALRAIHPGPRTVAIRAALAAIETQLREGTDDGGSGARPTASPGLPLW